MCGERAMPLGIRCGIRQARAVMRPVRMTFIPALAVFAVACAAARPLPGPAPGTARQVVEAAVAETLGRFASDGLKDEHLAVTLVHLREGQAPDAGHFRGDVPLYPASVVKLFYLAAMERWLEDGRLQDSPELRRAAKDMIVDSSNDATSYVVDVLTGTTSGPELPPDGMAEWARQRSVVQAYFTAQGYEGVKVLQKPWGDGPYGRERAFLGADFQNRNKLTTGATARLLLRIVQGEEVSAARSAGMMALLRRDPWKTKREDPDDQDVGFTALGLPEGSRLWAKAGWTSTARHDAAYVELPSKRRFVLVVFTTGFAKDRRILAEVVRRVVAGVERLP
jgi:hypothetical protein